MSCHQHQLKCQGKMFIFYPVSYLWNWRNSTLVYLPHTHFLLPYIIIHNSPIVLSIFNFDPACNIRKKELTASSVMTDEQIVKVLLIQISLITKGQECGVWSFSVLCPIIQSRLLGTTEPINKGGCYFSIFSLGWCS